MSYFTTTDNVKLYFEDKGSGTPVILIAGYTAPAETWIHQKNQLLESGYRVILFDRRSHGYSENPRYGQNMQRHAQDLDELIILLKLENTVLVGHSMGASVILQYLSIFGDAYVKSVVIVDQTPKMINDETWAYGMFNLNKDNLEEFFEKPLPSPFMPEPNQQVLETLSTIIDKYDAFDFETTKPLLLEHAKKDWRETLMDIDKPILFVSAKESPYWNYNHAKYAAKLCKKDNYAIIENCGHVVLLEQQDALNTILLDFLNM